MTPIGNYGALVAAGLLALPTAAAAQQRINAATGVMSYPSTLGADQYLTDWTVANLGTTLPCDSEHLGMSAYVTDATTLVFGGTLQGGGTLGARALCALNGTTYAWEAQ
jgi:hypothetical protein